MKQQPHIPPGFKLSPIGPIPYDWEVKTLKDVCTKIQDGNYGGDYPKAHEFIDSGIPFLTSKAIGGEGDIIKEKIDFISYEKHNQLKKAQLTLNDILFTNRGANVGTIGLVDQSIAHGNIGPQLTLLRSNPEKVHYKFLKEVMKSFCVQSQIRSQDSGSAMNFFGIGDTSKFKFPLPPLPEQKAIANLLSTWDKAIETTQKLIAQKELRKKWLMQVLLTGKKRVKGFICEWKNIYFKKAFIFIKSYSLTRDKLTTKSDFENIFCIHYGDIHALYDNEFLDFSYQKLIPKIIDYKFKISEKDLLKNGDIIIADASEDYEGIGEAVEIINLKNEKVIGGLHTIVLRDISGGTEDRFRAYLFSSETVRNNLRRKATGTSVYSITKPILEKLSFNIPDKEEQFAISQILFSADKEIQFLQTKLEKLKEQKKGLMQVLLTGKKRLKTE